MIFKVTGTGGAIDTSGAIVKLRCPVCHQKGTFETLAPPDLQIINLEGNVYRRFGQRRCPDPDCGAHIFFVWDNNTNRVTVSYPAERLDFDATNVPANVVHALEEAITCHANQCYVAAAIMVRKTLEELCSDQKATGKNLKERIKALGTKVVLPKDLLDGLDDLRLLGNDAAHIESHEFNQVGTDEIEVGIEFTKEVLKATYQYSALLSRLRGLKKTP
jgi:hypothetical protein